MSNESDEEGSMSVILSAPRPVIDAIEDWLMEYIPMAQVERRETGARFLFTCDDDLVHFLLRWR